jgi:hypothetical protein
VVYRVLLGWGGLGGLGGSYDASYRVAQNVSEARHVALVAAVDDRGARSGCPSSSAAMAGGALGVVDGASFGEDSAVWRGALVPVGDNARRHEDGTGGEAGADQDG